MAASKQKPELIAIVGPTASGKSELAMRVARKYNGEIICADSRTVYKGMNIGTAKPSKNDQEEVKHWGLDLVNPGVSFSAKRFKDYALGVIDDIKSRGKLPIIVGGTGLYIDSLIFDFNFRARPTEDIRDSLEQKTVLELQAQILSSNYPMPENSQNKRHLIRAIETQGKSGTSRQEMLSGTVIVGIRPSSELLRERIQRRAETAFKTGLIEETKKLVTNYGEPAIRRTAGIAYLSCLDLINRKIDRAKAIELTTIAERQYAKRQLTWFRRNPYIHWNEDIESAERTVEKLLNN